MVQVAHSYQRIPMRTYAIGVGPCVTATVLYCRIWKKGETRSAVVRQYQSSSSSVHEQPQDRGRLTRNVSANGRVEHRTIAGLPGWAMVLLRMATDALVVFAAFVIAWWLRYDVEIGGAVSPAAEQPFSFFSLDRCPADHPDNPDAPDPWRISSAALDDDSGRSVRCHRLCQHGDDDRHTLCIRPALFSVAARLSLHLAARDRIACREALRARDDSGRLWLRGVGVDRVLVVGAGQAGQRVLQWLLGQPQLGYQVVGVVDDVPPPANWAIATERRVVYPPHLGTCENIGEIVRQQQIDEVIIALPPTAHQQMAAIVDQCRAQDVEFKLVPDLFELTMDRVHIHDVAGLPMIALRPARISGTDYVVKRTMDIFVSAVVLALMSPILLLVALSIKLDSPGDVLYRQERVGRSGRRFVCFKFRSMVENADRQKEWLAMTENVDPRRIKIRDDPRRTRVGKFIRRTSIDELPQFLNVLLGDMSVVGPRPQVPDEVARYDEWHFARLLVTPGLTGLWQVGGRSDLTFDEMVRLDLYYAEHWSPVLDIKIIMRTIPAVLTSRGAY